VAIRRTDRGTIEARSRHDRRMTDDTATPHRGARFAHGLLAAALVAAMGLTAVMLWRQARADYEVVTSWQRHDARVEGLAEDKWIELEVHERVLQGKPALGQRLRRPQLVPDAPRAVVGDRGTRAREHRCRRAAPVRRALAHRPLAAGQRHERATPARRVALDRTRGRRHRTAAAAGRRRAQAGVRGPACAAGPPIATDGRRGRCR
jgi:hypothetical protein